MTIGIEFYPERGLLTWTTQRLPFNLYCNHARYRICCRAHHELVPLILDVVDDVTEDD